jgi:hypothetical protein
MAYSLRVGYPIHLKSHAEFMPSAGIAVIRTDGEPVFWRPEYRGKRAIARWFECHGGRDQFDKLIMKSLMPPVPNRWPCMPLKVLHGGWSYKLSYLGFVICDPFGNVYHPSHLVRPTQAATIRGTHRSGISYLRRTGRMPFINGKVAIAHAIMHYPKLSTATMRMLDQCEGN